MFKSLLLHINSQDSLLSIEAYHSFFLLFPILAFTGTLICDLLNSFGRSRALRVGHWFVLLGVLFCIPTISTGLEAAQHFNPDDAVAAKHRLLGYATGISGSIYAGLRLSVMIWKLEIPAKFYLGLSVLLVALVSWTSDYGALINAASTRNLSVPLSVSFIEK